MFGGGRVVHARQWIIGAKFTAEKVKKLGGVLQIKINQFDDGSFYHQATAASLNILRKIKN